MCCRDYWRGGAATDVVVPLSETCLGLVIWGVCDDKTPFCVEGRGKVMEGF